MLETTLCYIEAEGSYLMLFRNKKTDDVNAGKWIGLGGKIETGDRPDECLIREVREESGLILKRYQYRGIVDFCSDGWQERMHLYTADLFSGELTECNEGRLEWIPKAHLENLPLWEGDRVFLNLIKEDSPFFHLTLFYEGERLAKVQMDDGGITLQ